MKRAVVCLLLFAFIIHFTSCEPRDAKTAEERMREFSENYQTGGVTYSPTVPEGERGFCDADFFRSLFGREADGIADYAVLLLSHPDGAGECAIFFCYTANDALNAAGMCEDRLSLLRSSFGIDTACAQDAFILRRGRITVFCALSDNARAKEIWERIL